MRTKSFISLKKTQQSSEHNTTTAALGKLLLLRDFVKLLVGVRAAYYTI